VKRIINKRHKPEWDAIDEEASGDALMMSSSAMQLEESMQKSLRRGSSGL
jgi:hypothetical protein